PETRRAPRFSGSCPAAPRPAAAPASFTDQQVRGPFKYLRHTHEFRPDGSGTLMVDTVEFAAPFGALGRLVEKLVLARYMENLIRERNEFLVAQALATPDPGR
ncbi:SRPBCC family protein, partial [Paenarthrobacter ureafaciens]|uniref:SRPBCC family protein n=1 Tax=Paenarthrobacter ureafaciens TaxID=37931 RepID=UPI00397D8154